MAPQQSMSPIFCAAVVPCGTKPFTPRLEEHKRTKQQACADVRRHRVERHASFACLKDKEAEVAETIRQIDFAVRKAENAVEIAAFNLRRRRLSELMGFGEGSSAADGDSDEDTSLDSEDRRSTDESSGDEPGDSQPPALSGVSVRSLATARMLSKESTCSAAWKSSVLERIDEMRMAHSMAPVQPSVAMRSLAQARLMYKERTCSKAWKSSVLEEIDEMRMTLAS